MKRLLPILLVALLVALVVHVTIMLSAPHAPEIVPRVAGNASFVLVLAGLLAVNRKVQVKGRRALVAVVLFLLLNLACIFVALAKDNIFSLLLLFPILAIGYYPPGPDPQAMYLWALSLPVPVAVGMAIGAALRRLRPEKP